MPDKTFQRRIEDFTCLNCGAQVQGNGYTNHCPQCLWSKHVDINPGDRLSPCGGAMKPVHLEQKNGEYRITHRCVECGYEKINKVADNDNVAELARLSAHH